MRGRSRTKFGRLLDRYDWPFRRKRFLREPLDPKPDHEHEMEASNISESDSADAARRLRQEEAEERARDGRDK